MPASLTIIIEAESTGDYSAYIPEVPGVFGRGSSPSEAKEVVLRSLDEVMLARRQWGLLQRSDGAIIERVAL